MDIFTTQLTRVVPVPIKSENLKVKALLKEAAIKKLKQDSDAAEEHDYYLDLSPKDEEESNADDKLTEEKDALPQNNLHDDKAKEHDNEEPHLDLYI